MYVETIKYFFHYLKYNKRLKVLTKLCIENNYLQKSMSFKLGSYT